MYISYIYIYVYIVPIKKLIKIRITWKKYVFILNLQAVK